MCVCVCERASEREREREILYRVSCCQAILLCTDLRSQNTLCDGFLSSARHNPTPSTKAPSPSVPSDAAYCCTNQGLSLFSLSFSPPWFNLWSTRTSNKQPTISLDRETLWGGCALPVPQIQTTEGVRCFSNSRLFGWHVNKVRPFPVVTRMPRLVVAMRHRR